MKYFASCFRVFTVGCGLEGQFICKLKTVILGTSRYSNLNLSLKAEQWEIIQEGVNNK